MIVSRCLLTVVYGVVCVCSLLCVVCRDRRLVTVVRCVLFVVCCVFDVCRLLVVVR